MPPLILLTGPPRIGKSTALEKAVQMLRGKGLRVGGMVTSEILEGGRRVGFSILDLASGRGGILARQGEPSPIRVGRYGVRLGDLREVGARAILDGVVGAEVVVVDEIGPMELFSHEFISAVERAVESPKPVIASLHQRTTHPIAAKLRGSPGAVILEITEKNRDVIPEKIVALVGGLAQG